MSDLLAGAASAMDAQRAALDVCARNVAAAEAAGPNGNYTRQIPEFTLSGDEGDTIVQFAGTREERGNNVDVITEMIAVMNASRAYESDASLFDVGKTLEERTIDMGRLA
ncbi:MAG TPA: flagellar basal body rod C-terminal domain-containing protein [Candidatus Acidoferrum sp.]|nr:flagellar basal body rod C-terminal domain-containing protein [Candidatus Acidoferrum sp.]